MLMMPGSKGTLGKRFVPGPLIAVCGGWMKSIRS
jgi:hypothetical protein